MDIIGRKFGRLTVVDVDPENRKRVICHCECGTVKSIRATQLTKHENPTRSCGCLQRELAQVNANLKNKHNFDQRAADNTRYNTNFSCIGRDKLFAHNTSGATGVYFKKSNGTWYAKISVHGKFIHLGTFATKEEAIMARKRAEMHYHQPLIDQLKEENTP